MPTGWYLENRTGTHDKFYAVVAGPGWVAVQWGRRGTAGQTRVYRGGPAGAEQVRRKQARGYRVLADGVAVEAAGPDDAVAALTRAQQQAAQAAAVRALTGGGGEVAAVAPGWADAIAGTPGAAEVAEALTAAGRVVAHDPDDDVALLHLPVTAPTGLRAVWPRPLVTAGDSVDGDDVETLATAVALVGDVGAGEDAWRRALAGARALGG